jgi:hypothetical protein
VRIRPFGRHFSDDQDLEQVQDRLEEFFVPLQENEFLEGNLIQGIAITAGTPVIIDHLLDRLPRGWIVTDCVANRYPFRTAWDARTITLDCAANNTIDIWVF